MIQSAPVTDKKWLKFLLALWKKIFLQKPRNRRCFCLQSSLGFLLEKRFLKIMFWHLLNVEGLFYFIGDFFQILFIVLGTWQRFTRAV